VRVRRDVALERPGHQWDSISDFFASELRRAAEQHDGDEAEDTIVEQVVERVLARHPSASKEELDERARADYRELRSRPITTYIPNLMEHALRDTTADDTSPDGEIATA
jgi:ketosteroid isomerase-like protein